MILMTAPQNAADDIAYHSHRRFRWRLTSKQVLSIGKRDTIPAPVPRMLRVPGDNRISS